MDSIQLPPSIDDSRTEDVNLSPPSPPPEPEPEPQFMYYEPQPQFQYYEQPPQVSKPDPFSNLDKTAYVVIFIAFILGFFMGKTMQPVILRHG
jgi:hypothetical protein